MGKCAEIRAYYYDYIDGELEGKPLDEMIEHLEACRGCFSHAEFLRILKVLIHKTGNKVHAKPTLKTKIIQELQRNTP